MSQKLRVLLLGSGGREHAIAESIKRSPLLGDLKVFPGNAGFDKESILPKNSINWNDKLQFQNAIRGQYDLVVVGPEDPLVNGISDWCEEIGIPCFGPSAYCAQIEGSKDFAKNLMLESGVPTSKFQTFEEYNQAFAYTKDKKLPIVIKADGLAAGKGVTVCTEFQQVDIALKEIFIEKKFGVTGNRVVIEDFLEGEEASIFAICDGENYVLLPPAQDHKRAFDNDEGPNTGGMGAYCPAPVATSQVIEKVKSRIVEPILQKFIEKKSPYKGVLYVGLMIHSSGDPYVVEFNCRFGDPETQAVLQLVQSDLLEIFWNVSNHNFNSNVSLKLSSYFSSIVVLAANGYPGDYIKNIPIHLEKNIESDTKIFHSGTKFAEDGSLVSNGGRVLGIVSIGVTLKESIDKTYKFIHSMIHPSLFFRTDIGRRAL
jgi:phosphoribosylamine--glycine ligase